MISPLACHHQETSERDSQGTELPKTSYSHGWEILLAPSLKRIYYGPNPGALAEMNQFSRGSAPAASGACVKSCRISPKYCSGVPSTRLPEGQEGCGQRPAQGLAVKAVHSRGAGVGELHVNDGDVSPAKILTLSWLRICLISHKTSPDDTAWRVILFFFFPLQGYPKYFVAL